MDTWLLPEHIDDILPAEAQRIEALRRALLDLFRGHGYELVLPPMIEYLDSLLTGTGHDLDLMTFKLVDQMSGRLLGLRADITPQAARIDAHLLNRTGITRLCYAGSVLHAMPAGVTRRRELFQIGAELYGHGGLESDVEIQRLMLQALERAGCRAVQLDLGHVGVFRCLIRRGGIVPGLELELFRALQGKDLSALRELVAPLTGKVAQGLLALIELYGDEHVLGDARRRLPSYPEIQRALDELQQVANDLADPPVRRSFDLGELRGYHYHTGMVFAAYVEGCADAVGRGGRYDEIGRAFGRARPATGFTLDLRDLAALRPDATPASAILAPYSKDPALRETVERLRAQGEVVIVDLPGQESTHREPACDRELRPTGDGWQVAPRAPVS